MTIEPTSGADANAARTALVAALAAVARGDETALRKVYDLTCPKLFGICLRICRDRSAAEDVLQSVYVKIWDRAGQFEADRASPITWLCTIARNAAIDWRRSAEGRARLVSVPEQSVRIMADDGPTADAILVDREEHERLRHCLDELEPQKGDCIRAAFFDGMTYAEIAERENVPIGTMKSWIRRALLRLRDCLGNG